VAAARVGRWPARGPRATLTAMVRAMWILAVVAGCSSKPPPLPPAPPKPVAMDAAVPETTALEQDLPRLVERSLVMQQAIAAALTAAGDDCAAATARLGELTGTYRDVVVANARVLHDGRARELHAALDPRADAFDRAAADIMKSPTTAKCVQDPAFAQAFEALFEPPP